MNAFSWSVRRELWEHRSIWITPLVVAAFVLFAIAIHIGKAQVTGTLPPAQLQRMVAMPFAVMAAVIIVTTLVVAAFFCLDALNGERRDRSILFWKSMPVTDATTVLSKAFIPLVVAPAVAFAVALLAQVILLLPAHLLLEKAGAAGALAHLPLATMAVSMLYGLVAQSLWLAPVYALLLLVSVAVRRPLLWVIVPVIVAQVLERIAFGTSHVGAFIHYRLAGAMAEAFAPGAAGALVTPLSQLDPARFARSPGLWLGLLAAALFLFLAIRIRRSKEPL